MSATASAPDGTLFEPHLSFLADFPPLTTGRRSNRTWVRPDPSVVPEPLPVTTSVTPSSPSHCAIASTEEVNVEYAWVSLRPPPCPQALGCLPGPPAYLRRSQRSAL